MNIEDLAKMAISEVNSELDNKKSKNDEFTPMVEEITQEKNTNIQEDKIKKEINQVAQELIQELDDLEVKVKEDKQAMTIKVEALEEKEESIINNEEFFLKNIRERILVLFEGLKNTKDEHIEKRLDITITFLEFLLAKIEDRLKK
ncbi:2-oxoglutarate:acceptor oxidoreductase [Campylobacter sp. LMG 7929]|uniref:effector protein CiaD n=1 Tax=unclassified Campylobacter TaxID=2593542 RepID=UPI0021E63B32|nr:MULTISPECIES: 2-oxoglutarate:acceptor oxidoreductase [unclassified Campylobacter]EGK7485299.1 2-oxoglutarate:acceptor oxidoreductase [Campylobacter lari]MCR8682400.1 2-oxoglutarate:acceptor oxidoreductase [Campylobacter sp. LMG 17559]MCR8697260.1 2-oxoglutarate:acceptor oxidoreductase [Campylobacter sp. LMG 7929]MCV3336495.1 2-oxoglutarate:acceptor oxidoreductase [Campylobacter sp. RKI_CA19_01121]MCV3386926.1 2-oxoglutarate:acceptor oxidoreductase [Campylobacter sp. IFREMER_LSEM_CL2256]